MRLEWTIEIFMYLHMQRVLGLGFSTFQNRDHDPGFSMQLVNMDNSTVD
jgi:hypothetical protein